MVKNKKALILLLIFLAFFNSPAYPGRKSINYLPSNQDVETVSKVYKDKVLEEIECSSCEDSFSRARKCSDCVDLKEKCPNCCLTTVSSRVIKCSPEDTSADYDCTPVPFTSGVGNCEQVACGSRGSETDCDTLICSGGLVSSGSPYGLQRRGCPDENSNELKPDCSACTEISGTTGKDRVWRCPTSCGLSPRPAFQPCSETSGPPRCDKLGSYYDVVPAGVNNRYSLNSTFKGCIDSCAIYADDYEKCRDRVNCCEQAVCKSGYKEDCTDSSCKERLTVGPLCYTATAGRCAKLNQEAQECLEGGMGSCFEEIDSNIRYDFTARSGEAYNVIWQINTKPIAVEKGSNTKFFTMVKVVNLSSGEVVYRSMLHQKNLNAAFSIYGTTLIPKGSFRPGKRYQIQVHYFMNDDDNTDYRVGIEHMGLIVIRVRE